jgi:hypothetical protein
LIACDNFFKESKYSEEEIMTLTKVIKSQSRMLWSLVIGKVTNN